MLANAARSCVARTAASRAALPFFKPQTARLTTSVVAMSTKLYVGNLSWDTRKEDLEDLFGRYGQVEDAFVASDRETGRSRGFGFVTLADGHEKAIEELDNSEYQGRNIRVNPAQPQGERTGGGGRGYGGGRGGFGGRGRGGDRYGGGGSYGGGRGGGRGYGRGGRGGYGGGGDY